MNTPQASQAESEEVKPLSENEKIEQLVLQYGKASHVDFDEMLANGQGALIKDHWAPLMRALGRHEPEDLESKHREARRIMRESGVTYNVYNDPQGRNRALQLDPIPMLMEQKDWSKIEKGLAQRARVLNFIFKDIYGSQQLIKEGFLPPELVFSHRGYHRNCIGLYDEQEHPIFNYSADLARGPDGNMWVFSDRTQAPSGSGYALETRIAMSRVMAGEFSANKVRRLSHYFRSMRASLANLRADSQSDPRIVLMTPGPLNETYFEHAYLSSYLGYTLVQGADLTVRDGKVWLKSIDGLRQVDIILRRVDDSFCDPLELREDSHLGVPGLAQAVRDGTVTVVNPLGSGIVESPALYPFMKNIAKQCMDEELLMPYAATWWCGQEKERNYVLDNLEKLVIKTIDRREPTTFGGALNSENRKKLREKIIANPYIYLGQERLICSSSPALVKGEILPRRVLLRAFLVASEEGYNVMPGGLTRIAPSNDSFLITNQSGGVSKDTWVLTDQPDRQRSLLPDPTQTQRALENESLLPSRSAENLYWVGRYAERTEGVVRLLRTLLRKMADFREYSDEADEQCLTKILWSLTHLTETYPGFLEEDNETLFEKPENEILDVAFDSEKPGSLISTLKALYFGAFNVRDLWSVDTWRIIDDIGELITSFEKKRPSFFALHNRIDQIIDALMAFSGLTQESMSHENGRFMFDLGKRLERGLQVVKLVRGLLDHHDSDLDELVNIEALMTSQESLTTYRRRYRLSSSALAAISLLVLDENHPRSIAYQIVKLQDHFKRLPRQTKGLLSDNLNDEEKLLLKLRTVVQLSEPVKLARVDKKTGQRLALVKLLDEVDKLLKQLSDKLTHRYFSHTDFGRQLAPQFSSESE
jgi:uncharacterized circularly permuted ATP-grasp superfamily protein/uncharacterized alpha-E superfamily protein